MKRLDREMDYDEVEVEDLDLGEQTGLMRVLNNKQKQIDLLKEKIDKLEEDNNKFDKMGNAKKKNESIDFEFELEGKLT